MTQLTALMIWLFSGFGMTAPPVAQFGPDAIPEPIQVSGELDADQEVEVPAGRQAHQGYISDRISNGF